MDKDDTILVLGGSGMVGSAIRRALDAAGFVHVEAPGRSQLDLLDAPAVHDYFMQTNLTYVFVAAARVGGILANDSLPTEFLYENLVIETNVIHQVYLSGVRKLLNLGSTCVYPRLAPQPLKEKYFLMGELEPTNEWYAIAKIAGIKLCEAYRKEHGCQFVSAMPTNLYGPNDNFNLETSHVVPALIRKFREAKKSRADFATIWGSGEPLREFLHVYDCADACLFLMQHYDDGELVNIGVGQEISIIELAKIIAKIVGFAGNIELDLSKPDGTPRKAVDITRLAGLGWQAQIDLKSGIRSSYDWYCSNVA